jgi:hypothetical protein
VSSISQAYNHLKIILFGRGDNAANGILTLLRFNNDSAANYDWQDLFAQGAVAGGAETFAATTIRIGQVTGSTGDANLAGFIEIMIPCYALTTFEKRLSATSSAKVNTSANGMQVDVFDGSWRSTAAINRITIFPTAGNFVAGSRLTIYGLL